MTVGVNHSRPARRLPLGIRKGDSRLTGWTLTGAITRGPSAKYMPCPLEKTMARTILLTGRPGVGKTTVIKKIAQELGDAAGGFYTAEIRERGQRKGFKIVTLDGEEGILAHVDIKGSPRVSKYGVNLRDLEEIGVAAVRRATDQAQYVVIDEIGKMELFSEKFRRAVLEAVRSDRCVVGTVMRGRSRWVDGLTALPHVLVLELTEANRDQMVQRVLDLLDAGSQVPR